MWGVFLKPERCVNNTGLLKHAVD